MYYAKITNKMGSIYSLEKFQYYKNNQSILFRIIYECLAALQWPNMMVSPNIFFCKVFFFFNPA